MAGKSNIEWTGHTWNPIAGCSVKSPGCKHCYAMPMAARLEAMGQALYVGLTTLTKAGPVFNGTVRQAGEHVLLAPLKRKKPTVYFVNSMSDLFHENVPDEWIDRIFAVMALSPQHTFQVLTKRADRMREYCLTLGRHHEVDRVSIAMKKIYADIGFGASGAFYTMGKVGWHFKNIWLGVSTERQTEADERIPLLLETPAAVRFISAEPLLAPIILHPLGCGTNALSSGTGPNLDWVIVGGESGRGYRMMNSDWARSLRDQCADAGVAVFIKQMAGKKPIPADLMTRQFPS